MLSHWIILATNHFAIKLRRRANRSPNLVDLILRHAPAEPLILTVEARLALIASFPHALWYEFPDDEGCVGINDQYFLGPTFLVAPVTTQGSTTREMYFPKGASWKNIFDGTIVAGGAKRVVRAPLDQIPVYERQ